MSLKFSTKKWTSVELQWKAIRQIINVITDTSDANEKFLKMNAYYVCIYKKEPVIWNICDSQSMKWMYVQKNR